MKIKTHCWERATKGECEFAEVAPGFMTALRAAMTLSNDKDPCRPERSEGPCVSPGVLPLKRKILRFAQDDMTRHFGEFTFAFSGALPAKTC